MCILTPCDSNIVTFWTGGLTRDQFNQIAFCNMFYISSPACLAFSTSHAFLELFNFQVMNRRLKKYYPNNKGRCGGIFPFSFSTSFWKSHYHVVEKGMRYYPFHRFVFNQRNSESGCCCYFPTFKSWSNYFTLFLSYPFKWREYFKSGHLFQSFGALNNSRDIDRGQIIKKWRLKDRLSFSLNIVQVVKNVRT